MKQIINPMRVLEIMRFIKNKEIFVMELIAAINNSLAENNHNIIDDCLTEWEATAELNSIPGFASNVKRRYRLLVKAGLINAE